MRRLAILLAGAALLAGCAAPAVPEAASAVQAVSSEAGTGHAGSRTEQLAVLDGLVDFGADTAGCSLKTAQAAAVLVEYLSASEFEDGTADTWRAGLSGDAQERLALNWPGILAEAQAICADPAACADELASAGVETDFPGMELGGVPDKLTALDAVLGGIHDGSHGPELREISGPTIPLPLLPRLGYLAVPRRPNLPWGVAALVFAVLAAERATG